MAWTTRSIAVAKGNILPNTRLAELVEYRATQVTELLRERRKLALAFKRTRDEAHRIELEAMDLALAEHRIDIPAVSRQVASLNTAFHGGRRSAGGRSDGMGGLAPEPCGASGASAVASDLPRACG